MNSSKFVNP
jgi:hypothetical protein